MSENLRMRYLEEQYETLTTLGEPDAGRVFLVKDKRNGKIAVKKYVSAEAAGLYERLRGIKNRYMARVYETATDGQSGIVIEEYINGTTLGDYLEERNILQPEEVYHIMTQLCEVLAQIHERGIVHRDLNPENIMISEDGIVKLIDFGIARTVKEEKGKDTVILGTVGYAAPEQFGFTQTDARTDIYALGVLMYVMLSGQLPGQQIYWQGMPFGAVIQRCLELDPNKRFQKISELQEQLAQAVPVKREDKKHKGYQVAGVPGFRTGVLWKNVVACCGYIFMIFSVYVMLDQYVNSVESFFVELLAILFYVWISPLTIANVADWDRKLPGIRRLPWMLRLSIRIGLGMVFFGIGMSIEEYVKVVMLGLPASYK